MNTELKNAVLATDREIQYDNSAKRLIGHRIILVRFDIVFYVRRKEGAISSSFLKQKNLRETYAALRMESGSL